MSAVEWKVKAARRIAKNVSAYIKVYGVTDLEKGILEPDIVADIAAHAPKVTHDLVVRIVDEVHGWLLAGEDPGTIMPKVKNMIIRRAPELFHAPEVEVETEKRYTAVLGMLAGIRKEYARTRPILVSRIRNITRSALWPEYRHSKGQCDECGLPYDLFPCDMNIQDHLWEKIHDKAPGGYLCPTCICKRLMALGGFTVIKATINETELTAHLKGGGS